jgi:hypothetical protein
MGTGAASIGTGALSAGTGPLSIGCGAASVATGAGCGAGAGAGAVGADAMHSAPTVTMPSGQLGVPMHDWRLLLHTWFGQQQRPFVSGVAT